MDFWTLPRVGPPVDQVELVHTDYSHRFLRFQCMREKYRTKRLRRDWRRVGSTWTLVPGHLALIMSRLLIGLDVPLLSANSKTDDDLMLLTQIEIFRTKTS